VDILIFVTLGTQDKDFSRLLKIVEDEIKNKNIKEEVIVQSGHTKYESEHMKIFDYVSSKDFEKYVKECNTLITHGGVGSIMSGIKNNKKVIACPRLAKYKEHTNDHQLDIVREFEKDNYILALYEDIKLKDLLKSNKKNNKFKSNTSNLINLIENFIEEN